jgi:predicted DNA-binding transcriptional regulator AlpA
MSDEIKWLTGPQLRQRFSISAVGLHRWLNDERLQFPQPVKIRERLFWRLGDIEAFEKQMIAAGLRNRAASSALCVGLGRNDVKGINPEDHDLPRRAR